MESLKETRERLAEKWFESMGWCPVEGKVIPWFGGWDACQKEMEEKLKKYENQEQYPCHTTHHLACKCREEYFEGLEEKVAKMRSALEKIVSNAFHECQPDKGHLFGLIDDIARQALEQTKEGKND